MKGTGAGELNSQSHERSFKARVFIGQNEGGQNGRRQNVGIMSKIVALPIPNRSSPSEEGGKPRFSPLPRDPRFSL